MIKDPNSGDVITFNKPSASPAPSSRSPAIVSSSPPPPQASSNADATHHRTESISVKATEKIKHDIKDAVAKKVEADKAEEKRLKEEAESRALEEQKEADAKAAKAEEEAKAKQLEEAKAKLEAEAAAEKAKAEAEEAERAAAKAKEEADRAQKEREEEEEYARIEAELEREEREAEERYQKKKQAEKEEKARKEAEAAARADEDMKKAEREMEEAEDKRLKKLQAGESEESQVERHSLFAALKKDGPATPSSETPAPVDTPIESGAVTPVSEGSMAPPARITKQKPAHLKLETSKNVEPAQPSAALLSLRSARRLTSINDVSYPAPFASPNPALNSAAPSGKFRYDKEFLLQFQRAFVEKPSENWTERIKETVGDTTEPSSARPPSARVGAPMSARQPSIRGPTQVLGNFALSGGRTLPPGSTSQTRFQASTPGLASVPKNPMQNPLAPLIANRPGGFPVGMSKPMERTPSSTSMSGHPSSPRPNPSQRAGGGRNSRSGRPTRDTDKLAKEMPLTYNKELKPIEVTASGWKPHSMGNNATGVAGPAPGGDGHMPPDVVQRKVKSNLNKMTPNNFDKISDQILAIAGQSKDETDGRTLRQVIQLTFEKATDEAHWAQMYAEFCKRMLESMSPEIKDVRVLDKKDNVVVGGALFRKYLLTRCQEEFERGWKIDLPQKPEGEPTEAAMLSDEYYIAATAKRRGLGLVRFIGELYKLGMLTERIMHECVKKLVDYEGTPDEAEVESLTSLLKTIGENLDSTDRGRAMMDAYFKRIGIMIETPDLPSRLKFMLMVGAGRPVLFYVTNSG
jgi:translation initiation factor 4G